MSKRRSQPLQSATSSRTIDSDSSMVNQVASGSNAAKTNQKNAQPEAEPMAVDHALDDANISDDEEGGTRIGDIYIPPPVQPYCSTESKGPRLIIKKIVNHNFKSYAGKVVLGPFHHCFTAIIGPNGSGKSNVIDSMLFVFGYRANKIRCKKISTLLHNSALYPNMSSCSVAVHFRQVLDKDDGSYEELPDSEIVIERVAYRDNSSYYNLNGKRAQFKEVAKLLKSHNVDLDHNRFLILQGEVESIAMMKPKGQTENEVGMLEYLEDIVGTTRYKEPLRKINERVEQLTEERTEKHNRCQLAEREMKDLEQPFNDAVNYLRMENDHTRTKNLRIQKYISEKNKKLQLYTEEYEKVETELKNHDEEAANVKKEREEKEALVRKEMEQYEGLRKKKEDLQKAAEKARSKYTEVQQTMSVINTRRKKDKAQIVKCTEDLEELKHIPQKNEKEIEECKKKVEQLNKQKVNMEEALQKNYELVEEQTKPLIEQREKLETELIDLKRNVDTAKGALAQSETELRILKHEETTEKRKYETMKNSYESSENDLKESRERVQTLNKLLPEIQQNVKTKSEELKKLVAEEEQMRSTLMRIKSEVNEKTESMRATRSNNKVLDFLMRQKNEGHIPGILGRLGDLGGIDSKYDVAISTACGRLDNIIVETVEDAQQCIEKLKKYDVGRASFIALEKIEYLSNHSHPIKTPENAPRLYDLVRVEDERVLPAFYFALRNTLVATDMDQARRLAYGAQRFRVVTLTGGVIETSGTMSGGGRTMIRGKMGTKVQTKTMPTTADGSFVSQKDLEEMQIKAQDLQSKINYSQEQQGRLEREIYQLNADRQKFEGELQKLTISIKSLEEQISRIFKQVEAQKKRMQQTTSDPEKVKAIESVITKNQKNLKESENEADKVSSKINEFKEKIEAIHGDKVKSVQKGITNLNNQIKKLNNHISKLNVEVTTSERNVIKLEKQIESLQAEILKAQDEITNLNTVRQECDEESTKLDELVAEAEKAIQEAKSGSSGIQKEILALQKRESDSKLKRVEIEQQVTTALSKLNDVKHHIPKLREQLKPLQLNKIPDEAQPQDPLKTYTEEELATHSLHDLQFKESVEDEALKKKPNLSYIQEYMDKRNVYIERVKVLGDITLKRNEMRQLYDDVRKKRYNEFMQGFHIITRKLKEMYQMITQGGDAELELVDSLDPFTEGVSFSVRPPKKSWKNISNLSGGEKTLSSLALVFALHYYKPSPLYFMDEIDAALDFKNISIVAHYIKERTKNAQFIIISLRSNMFELADWLVGIYKVRDCTDTITIKNFQQYTPPMTQTQSQQTIAPTQNLSFARDTSMITSTQEPEPTPAIQNATNNLIDRSNDENSPMIAIMPSQGRDTTFAPNAELQSTVLSTQGRDTTFAPNAALQSTGITILNTSAQSIGTRISNTPSNASINDDIFKKPLPPQPAVSN